MSLEEVRVVSQHGLGVKYGEEQRKQHQTDVRLHEQSNP
jgi:hypothetical protein